MKKIRRLFSIAVACLVAFAATATGTLSAKAATSTLADLTGGDIKVTAMKNGTTDLLSESDPTVTYNSTIFTTIEWKIPDDRKWEPGDEFTYTLPDEMTFEDYSGDLENSTGKKGTYTIKDNVITVKYTDEKFCKVDDKRTGMITFSGAFYNKDSGDPQEKKVDLLFPIDNTISITVKPQDKNSDLSVAKDFYDYDTVNHIYDCKITVRSFSTNTNVTLDDEMWPGMSLYSKPKYYSDPQCTVELPQSAYEDNTAEPSETNRFVKAKFFNMGDKEEIYIKYQVKVHPDMYEAESAHALVDDDKYYPHTYGGNVPNKAAVKSDTVKDQRVAWADIGTLRSYIGKWVYTDLEDYTHGLIGWDIAIPGIYNSPVSTPITEGYIIDTLPLNSSFVTGSVVVKQEDQKTVIQDPITVEEGPVDAKTGRKTVIIHFNTNLLNYLKSDENARAWMFYQTKVDTFDGNDMSASNDVEIFYNGKSFQKTGADTTFYGPNNVEKIVSYNEATAPYAFYNIIVNPASFDLNPTGNTLTLVDEMCDSFDLVVSSVQINGADPKQGEFSYENNKMTFNLKDNEYYKITYKATVNLAVDTEFTSSNSNNTATLYADNTKVDAYYSTIKGKVYKSSGYSSSVTDPRRIDVNKIDKDDKTKALKGAKFTLTAMDLDEKTNVVTATSEKKSNTTEDAGNVIFNDIIRGTVYMLVENEAPTGYQLDETPKFYAFESAKDKLPAQVIYEGKSYGLDVSAASLGILTIDIYNTKIAPTDTNTPTPTNTVAPTPVTGSLKITKKVRGTNNLGEDRMKQIKITLNDENGNPVWSGTLGDSNLFKRGKDTVNNPLFESEEITIPDVSKKYTVTEEFSDVTNTVYLKVRYGFNTTDQKQYTVVDKDLNRDALTTSELTMKAGEVNTLYLENGYYVRDLKITKHTSGTGADLDKQFEIVAHLTPPAGGINWDNVLVVTNPASGSNVPTYTIDKDTNTITVKVANDQYVMLRRLPLGTTYIADEDLTGVIGYTLDSIVYCDNRNRLVNDFDTGPDCIDVYNVFAKPTDTNTPTPTNTVAPTETTAPEPTETTAPVPTETTAPEPTETTAPIPTETTAPEPTETTAPIPTETTAPEPTETTAPIPTETTAPTATDTPVPTNTAAPTDTPAPTNTTAPTDTPVPTATPVPTNTTAPTDTPAPTATSTPAPTATPVPTLAPTATVTAPPVPTDETEDASVTDSKKNPGLYDDDDEDEDTDEDSDDGSDTDSAGRATPTPKTAKKSDALVATGEDLTNVYILTAICFSVAAAAIVLRVRFRKED